MQKFSALIFIAFLLSACSNAPEATMPPTFTPTAMQIILMPTPAPYTPEPTASPVPTLQFAVCEPRIDPVIAGEPDGTDTRYALPEPGALSWQVLDARGSGRVWRLRGLNTFVSAITIAPSHTWATAELLGRHAAECMLCPMFTTLYGLDLEGGQSWQVRGETEQAANESAWLPDGRMLWVEAGQLWIANANGQGRRSLNAPGAVEQVWVSPGGSVLVSGDATWRLLMPDERWDRVAVVGKIADFNFSNDGGYGVALAPAVSAVDVDRFFIPATEGAIFTGEYWRIPMEVGREAELIPNSGVAGFTQGGGYAPWPLGGAALWQTGINLADATGTDGTPLLLDMQTRTLVPLSQALPGATRATRLEPSPSGRWVLINRKSIAPAEDLRQSLPLPNREGEQVLGWVSTSPDAVLVEETRQDTVRLLSIAPPDLTEEIELEVTGAVYLTRVPGYILFMKTAEADLGPQRTLLAYRVGSGSLAGQLTLNDASIDGPRIIGLDGRTLLIHTTLFSGGGEQPCEYSDAWLRWQVLP